MYKCGLFKEQIVHAQHTCAKQCGVADNTTIRRYQTPYLGKCVHSEVYSIQVWPTIYTLPPIEQNLPDIVPFRLSAGGILCHFQ